MDFAPLLRTRPVDAAPLWRLGKKVVTAETLQRKLKAWHRARATYPRVFFYDAWDAALDRRVTVLDADHMDRVLDAFRAEVGPAEWSAFAWEILGAEPLPRARTLPPHLTLVPGGRGSGWQAQPLA